MSMIGKDKLVFDTAATLADNDNVGAYLRASTGVLITRTTVGAKEAIDVNIASADPILASGSITGASQAIIIDVAGYSSVGIQVTGTWVATLGFDASVDGTNYVDLEVLPSASSTAVLTTTGNGVWYVNVGGLDKVRVFSDAFTSGTAVVTLQSNISTGKSPAGSSSGVTHTDDAAFAPGTDDFVPAGGTYRSTLDLVDDNDAGVFAMTQRRSLHASLRRESDGLEFGTSAIPFRVDPTGTTTQPTTATGNVADDAADSGNPVKVGSRAHFGAVLPAISTSADRADLISDQHRRLWINDSPNIAVLSTAITVGTSATALPATALVGRRRVIVQNQSNKEVFLGPTATVSLTNGLGLAARGAVALEIGQNVELAGIVASTTANVRVFELA